MFKVLPITTLRNGWPANTCLNVPMFPAITGQIC